VLHSGLNDLKVLSFLVLIPKKFFGFIQLMTSEKLTYEEKEETSSLHKILSTQAVQIPV